MFNSKSFPALIDSYYHNHDLSRIQIDAYNHLVQIKLPQLIESQQLVMPVNEDGTRLRLCFRNVHIPCPVYKPTGYRARLVMPNDARVQGSSYETDVIADVDVYFTDEKTCQHVVLNETKLFKLPVMLGSSVCSTTRCSPSIPETPIGGYFIIKGKERVVVAQESLNYNKVHIHAQKTTYRYIADLRSVKESVDYSVLLQLKLRLDRRFVCSIPYISHDIPIAILLQALDVRLQQARDVTVGLTIHDCLAHEYAGYSEMSQEDCIRYISQHTLNHVETAKKYQYTLHVLQYEIFPCLPVHTDSQSRGVYLLYIAEKILRTDAGQRVDDDRDHVSNKRIEIAGDLLYSLIRALFKRSVQTARQYIDKKCPVSRIDDLNLTTILTRASITQKLYYCFTSGNWGIPKSGYVRKGVAQILCRLSYIGSLSHLRRVLVPIGKKSRNIQVRQVHSTAYGYICPVETPEGQSVGIVKNFALLTRMCVPIPTVHIMDVLYSTILPVQHYMIHGGVTAVFLNGVWLGGISNRVEFVREFKELRYIGAIQEDVSISVDQRDNEIYIYSDRGRIMRPVIRYTHLHELDKILHLPAATLWSTCRRRGIVTYIDGNEAESSVIAMYPEPSTSIEYDYCEIHPCLMLGIAANTISFPDHSQAPRNLYVSAMMKQAIGVYSLSFQRRFDTIAHTLHYPQKRHVTTQVSRACGCEDHPSGANAIVAILCYTGFNQEDSVIINRSAIQRGLFRSTTYKTVSISEAMRGTHDVETIQSPPLQIRNRNHNYSKLDPDGIVRLNTPVGANDVLVGKIHYRDEHVYRDCSLVCKQSEEGIVDHIAITTNSNGYRHVKIRIRRLCIPEIGDKFCQISAQKGTCGMLYNQEDMPFTNEGIVPDIIINPHAIPSRMTINMLLEMLCAKASAFTGEVYDSSAFEHDGNDIVKTMGDTLARYGYERMGTEIMYNGFTGKPFQTRVFIAPAYYQRLKHLVSSKMHSRSYGNVQLLSRQPCAGRSRDGGLKFGEMERDSVIVHGAASFLKERLFDLSDPYYVHVCEGCGAIVNRRTVCMMCGGGSIEKVAIPYACKLLFQELQAMSVGIRIRGG